jgi:hypothetical protein
MQGNWRDFRSRTDAHKNAPKRSLFVNYSSNDLVGRDEIFWSASWPDPDYSSNIRFS